MNRPAWLLSFLTQHRGMKILSLLLAVLTWYVVRGIIGRSATLDDIPVVVKVRDGIAVHSYSPETVSVDFQGSQEELAQLEEAQIKGQLQAVVYSRGRQAGKREIIPIRPGNIDGVKGVRAVKVHRPAQVAVNLDAQGERRLPVRADCRGRSGGKRVVSVTCDPAYVRVRGARSRLDKTLVLKTEPVDLTGESESFTRSVRVLRPGGGWVLSIEPREVSISVTIEQEITTRKLLQVPVTAIFKPRPGLSVELSPAMVDVVLTGGSSPLDKMTTNNIKAVVDCTSLEDSTKYDMQVSVNLPPGTDVSAVTDPASVQVMLVPAR